MTEMNNATMTIMSSVVEVKFICSCNNNNNNNNKNNNNIYRGSPTRQGGFQWGPHNHNLFSLWVHCKTRAA